MNDNQHGRYGIVESPGLNQFLVVEYDALGPIMRLGPYAMRQHALDRLNALIMVADQSARAAQPRKPRSPELL